MMERKTSPAFARILIPLDGSALAEQALPYALAVGGDEADLVLVAVVPSMEAERDFISRLRATVEEVQVRSEAAARESLVRAVRNWLGDRPGVDLQVAMGDPAGEILRVAANVAADLIVLASHGRGAVGRLAFGSVAHRVAHASPIPVMIVRSQSATPEMGPVSLERLVVPLDGSDLAAQALPVAERLARWLALPILLVRAVDVAEILGPFANGVAFPATIIEDVESEARQALETTATALRADGCNVKTEVRTGPAFYAIAEVCRQGDIIVLCRHGRSGVRRWLLGSVAEKLVRDGTVPVVVVPADSWAVGETVTTAESTSPRPQ
jgi:nucleotide-binding universal stress UspA family protein